MTVEDVLKNSWPMSLDPDFDSSCPCCNINGDNFKVSVWCWRLQAGGSLIEVSGSASKEDKRRIAEHIRDHNGWTDRCDWQIDIQ